LLFDLMSLNFSPVLAVAFFFGEAI